MPAARLLLILIALILSRPAPARTTERWEPMGLLVDRWTTEDGLPLDHIISVTVSPAGFVWLATLDGLARFDGREFKVFRRTELTALPTNRILHVAVGADERPWLVTEDGMLVRLDRDGAQSWPVGRASLHAPDPDLSPGQLWLSSRDPPYAQRTGPDGPVPVPGWPEGLEAVPLGRVDGELWLSTRTRGLWRVTPEGAFEPIPGSEALGWVEAIAVDPSGGAWAATERGLMRADGARFAPAVPARAGLRTCAVHFTDRLWVSDERGWWTLEGGAVRPVGEQSDQPRDCKAGSWVIDGAVWRTVGDGLARVDGPVLRFGEYVRGVARGPDGELWVATNGAGLYRLRAPTLRTVAGELGNLGTVLALPDGSLQGNYWDGPPYRLSPDGARLPLPTLQDALGRPVVDPGTIRGLRWLMRDQLPWLREGDRIRPLPMPARGDPLREHLGDLLFARDGRIWMASTYGLSVGTPDGQEIRWETKLGPDSTAKTEGLCLTEGLDGSIWMATRGAGVFHLGPEGLARWTRAQGLSSDRVRDLWLAPDGALWVGTEDAGLCRLDAETRGFSCLGAREGLMDDGVNALLPDDRGRMWISTNRGIYWVLQSQLEDFFAGRRPEVLSLGLSEADGMLNRETNGYFRPAAARDAAGRLWFATQRGLARIDPDKVPIPEPPEVWIDEALLSGQRASLEGVARLEASSDQRELVVRWTTAETRWPDQVRSRYRLVGLDRDWSPATSAREARWTGLPPGELVLEVQAALAGDWGPPATLRLSREPTFVETRAFLVTLALGGLALGGLIALWRGARGRRARAELEALVAARTADLAASNRELEANAALLTAAAETEAAQAGRLREQALTLEQQNAALIAAGARLAEVDAMRTRLIADLSHELRTPLTLIAGPLEDLAESGEVAQGPALRRLDVALQNTRRLENLVDQLLDVARLESGKILLRVRRQDLTALLRRIAERFEPECSRRRLTLSLQLSDAPGDIFFDAELLEKVVSNLLSNALKFTPPGGYITLSLSAPPDEESPVCVEVRDTGVGVSEALRERLFDRFVQGESGDTRRFEGVGIGLALARDLVNMHGGDIGLDSAPGRGSRFWFTLPRGVDHLAPEDVEPSAERRPEPAAPPPEARLPVPPPVEGERALVLVVEDHPDMRDFLVAHLQRRFAVQAVGSGAEALAMARARRPDAIVSDVMMPQMDGLELCRQLRTDPLLREVPVLLASAKAAEQDRVAGLELADDYLTKPLRMRELLVRVQKLIDRAATPKVAPGEDEAPPSDAAAPQGLGPADLALQARIEETVAHHLSDPDFGVEQLAKALAFSRRQLLREVQRVTGQSPSDLLRARRMEEGHRLLVEGEVSTVSEAAGRVGLSAPYFSRTYTAWYKRAPSELLQRGRL